MNIFKKIDHFLIRQKYKKFNKKLFTELRPSKKTVLIEFNAFAESHVCQSLFANFLAKKFKLNIISYFNYCILAAPLKPTFFQKIRWDFGRYINFKNHGVYKSIGSKNTIRPTIINKNLQKEKKISKLIYQKLKNKNDILKIHMSGILIGDLIYDTFLKSNKVATIDIKDKKFFTILEDFVHLFYYWNNYFKENDVHSIMGVHSVYSYGLPIRIAISKGIKAYTINSREISKITNKHYFPGTNFFDYPKRFSLLKKNVQAKALTESKKILLRRVSGSGGENNHLISENSSFHSINQKTIIKKSNKIKILICTRNLFDAAHVFGNLLFPDNYEWLKFLGKLSDKTDYDWYLKTHINFEGKFKLYQPHSNKVIKDILKKYKKIVILPNDYSHKQIIDEKINYVLTQHGSVGFEYAFLGIPVINASYNNPQIAYKFNLHPKNKLDYRNALNNLKYFRNKIKIDKNKIKEFYYMRNIYPDRKWLFDNPKNMIKSIGGWDNMMNEQFYKYSMTKINNQKINTLYASFNKFLDSNYQTINIEDTSKI
tara:strand:+ start:9477 stop:11099 length:1623 start_codon:yes stop_codon:yes gene_type:complete